MTWLLCDYGEVLCLAPPLEARQALETAVNWNRAPEEFWAAYWTHRVAYDRGDLTAIDYWTAVLGRRPMPAHLDTVIEHDIAIWLHPNPASVEAIQRAAKTELQLAILSNAPHEVASSIDRAPWLGDFERKFFSCYIRSNKPDPAVYQAVLSALKASPEEIVFIDDRPANVAGAQALGIEAHLFDGPQAIHRILETLNAG